MADVAAGSSEALAAVYARLGPSVRAVGRRIVGDGAADDVVQETFERLWRHAARFDPRRGSPRGGGVGHPPHPPPRPPRGPGAPPGPPPLPPPAAPHPRSPR